MNAPTDHLAAPRPGSAACEACKTTTLAPELNFHRNAPTVCDDCMNEVNEAIRGLPAWVKDRDLDAIIPALVRAYVATRLNNEASV